MRTKSASLIDFLLGRNRSKILHLLFENGDDSFYVRQVAHKTGVDIGAVQRELTVLTRWGLLERSTKGNQVHFRPNTQHPLHADLRNLLAKTAGLQQQLQSVLAHLTPKLKFAVLFGSVARGEERADSDIDILLIGDLSLDEALVALQGVERVLNRAINPVVFSVGEFTHKLRTGNHFLKTVLARQKTLLVGDENELRELATV